MKFCETILSGSYLVQLNPLSDKRGWFMRTYDKNFFTDKKLCTEWVQINHSYTEETGTIRGMHYQDATAPEIKLVRCIAGAVFDVIVDLRKKSPTYLKWFGTELSAENRNMLYIPEGFAHGFQTLAPATELIYQHSVFYTSSAEAGVSFNDPILNIKWPMEPAGLSDRDKSFRFIDSNFKPFG